MAPTGPGLHQAGAPEPQQELLQHRLGKLLPARQFRHRERPGGFTGQLHQRPQGDGGGAAEHQTRIPASRALGADISAESVAAKP